MASRLFLFTNSKEVIIYDQTKQVELGRSRIIFETYPDTAVQDIKNNTSHQSQSSGVFTTKLIATIDASTDQIFSVLKNISTIFIKIVGENIFYSVNSREEKSASIGNDFRYFRLRLQNAN